MLLKGTGTCIDLCGTIGFHPKCFFLAGSFEQENSFDNGVESTGQFHPSRV
ncbi:putative Sema domain-containing protein [Helianthus debilis subsp. tardiflorus]